MKKATLTVNVIGFGQVDREILLDLQSKGHRFYLVRDNGDKELDSNWHFNAIDDYGYSPSTTMAEIVLKDALSTAKQKKQEALIKALSEQADTLGYTLVKKEVKTPWKFHDYDLNANPEDLLKVKAGDIVKLKTYYFLVQKEEYYGKYYLTMIDFQKNYVKPSDIGIAKFGYGCVHVRDEDLRATGDILWLYGLIKSGEYTIS
jgi:hypothetical protein